MNEHDPPLALSDISTTWHKVHEPLRFVMTYGPASRAYLLALLRNTDAVDEVLQQVLLQVTEKGFPALDPARGRFRHYLKAILRNAAARYRRPDRLHVADADVEGLTENTADDEVWREQWQACILGAAWRGLERHQRHAGRGNLAYTALRHAVDHPDLDSVTLATLVASAANQPLSADAFRKQLSRARRVFAELIVAEVQQSLDGGSAAEVVDELAELGLLRYVRDFLPDEYRH